MTRGQLHLTIMDIIGDGSTDIFTISLFCFCTVAVMNSVYSITSLLGVLMVSFRDLIFFFRNSGMYFALTAQYVFLRIFQYSNAATHRQNGLTVKYVDVYL